VSEKLSYAELTARLEKCPPRGTRWWHWKNPGRIYWVAGAAIAEATQQPLVLYAPEDVKPAVVFARPLAEWTEWVDQGGGRRGPRFEMVRSPR